ALRQAARRSSNRSTISTAAMTGSKTCSRVSELELNAIRVRRLQSGSADKHHMSASRLSVPAQQGPTVGMVIELSQAMVVMDKMAASQNIPAMRNVPAKTKSRNSRRLIFLLILFFITILLLLFFHSSYSRITSIEIRGQIYVSEESIKEASGIELNDHFFLVSP